MKAKLIVGLGNPGAEYANTYHNVGAEAVRAMAHALGAMENSAAWDSHRDLFQYLRIEKAVFMIPLIFMNNAGNAVKEAAKKFHVVPEDIVVVHDESDMTVGTYKFSVGRGSAGHKGVKSIMDALRSQDFLRVRIGIRAANERKRKKAEEFVLAAIKPKDKKVFQDVFEKILAELFAPDHSAGNHPSAPVD